jgi:hypothetical protein
MNFKAVSTFLATGVVLEDAESLLLARKQVKNFLVIELHIGDVYSIFTATVLQRGEDVSNGTRNHTGIFALVGTLHSEGFASSSLAISKDCAVETLENRINSSA